MLLMYDSITIADMPGDADVYLGYVNGSWPTFGQLAAKFPGKRYLDLAVSADHDATGLDVEVGDATPEQVPGWVARQHARGVALPVVYAARDTMTQVLQLVDRATIRVLTAHVGKGPHLCGPACGWGFIADGTQWAFPGQGSPGHYDISMLVDTFFQSEDGNVALSQDDIAQVIAACQKAVQLEFVNDSAIANYVKQWVHDMVLEVVLRSDEAKAFFQAEAKAGVGNVGGIGISQDMLNTAVHAALSQAFGGTL